MKKIIILVSFFVLLIIIFGIIYFVYEKPKQEEIESFSNINILFKDNNTPISTNYTILVNNIAKNGKSVENGYVLEKVKSNSSVTIYNNDEYYINSYFINNVVEDNYRIEIELIKPGNLYISSDIINSSFNNLMIETDGVFKNPNICMKWSTHFIKVDFINLSGSRTDEFDRCFNINKTLNNESLNLTLKYTTWGIIDNEDFIKLFITDEKNNLYNYTINTFL